MTRIARTIESFASHVLTAQTWGDGLYVVLDDVAAAANCALALQETVASVDLQAAGAGLGALRGIRIAASAAPVFDGWDPVSGVRIFFGKGVTQTARIEPRTPEGEVYVTHQFASLTALGTEGAFETQYVGTIPTAKDYGPLPLFALRRRT